MSRISPGREVLRAVGAGLLELLLFGPALLVIHAYLLLQPSWPLLYLLLAGCYGAGCWVNGRWRLQRMYKLLLFTVPCGMAVAWVSFPHRPLSLVVGGLLCMVALYRGARTEGSSLLNLGACLSGIALYFAASAIFVHVPELEPYAPVLLSAGILALAAVLLVSNRLMLQREAAAGSSERPPRGVRLQNQLQLGLLLLTALALALLPQLDRALAWLREQLSRLLSGLSTGEAEPEEALPQQPELPSDLIEEGRAPSALLQLLERVAGYILTAIIAAVMLWALYQMVRRIPGIGARLRGWLGRLMVRGEGEQQGYSDEMEALPERELRPQAKRRRRDTAGHSWREDMSAQEKVRYLYAAWLRKQQDRGYTPRSHLTPRETVEELGEQRPLERASAEQLLQLYEPARYGGDEPEADAIRRVKAELDQHKRK
ncbi:DUF4129 domain-containing protein [Paenibacillus sp. SYP-B4298]|uniref:DUF4129 domain-containing protein n=1 Tax=Paenibacillus sp. SYP-B4298 TaxID=2996034 RepID=UPI0022DE34BB|nr:DUF4129 domain-containing protein [Paenibacillus sp. SYP-B4298]